MTTTPTPRRAAGIAPNPAASPGPAVPRGRTGPASPAGSPVTAGLATPTSQSLRVPRSEALGTPDPAAAARGLRGGSAAGRVRRAPGGMALDADSALSPGQRAIAAAMSEDKGPDSLEAHVRKLMKDLGLTGFHVEKSLDVEKNRKNVSVKGWPDWAIRGPRGVLFRELKSQRGRVEPEQREWLDALAADGADADVWRPSDLLSGRITAELAALAGLGGAG